MKKQFYTKLIALMPLADRIQKEDNLNDVYYEDKIGPGNGYHHYKIERITNIETGEGNMLCDIQFQEGPRNEKDSIDGIVEADLLEIVRHRLQCFQQGEFATRENAIALTHIEEALLWMNKRKEDRKYRGVLGTNEK